tara:strand:+ start:1408 stop:2646 length:1239 start_codon:yes stop_codon:yes gene_type:complete
VENQGLTKEMISVNNALNTIVSNAKKLRNEKIPILESLGRVASENVYAKINNPPQNVSSMDGYAVRYSNLKNLHKKPIKIIGESSAGKPYTKKIDNYECIRIFTGASVPSNTNVILLQEKVLIKKNFITNTTQNYNKNQYIRKKGSNFKKKSLILKKNNSISSRKIGLLISANHTEIKVFIKPKIAILATGNEIRKNNKNLKNGIISSNTPLLISLLKSLGSDPYDIGIAKDSTISLKNKLININDYNILITTGGASVGRHDLVKDVLIELGMKLIFWKVAMRPGKPLIFGKIRNTLVLGFPGNPVSTFVSTLIFAKPLINKYLNLNRPHNIKKGILSKNLKKNDERQEYLRAKTFYKNNNYYVTPFNVQDSSMTSYLSESNSLIIRKPYDKALKIGNKVSIIIFSNINTHI